MGTGSGKYLVTEIRILARILMETVKAVKQSGWMNLVIVTTMAAILSIFGCLFRSSLGLANFLNEMGNILEVSVYIKSDASTQTAVAKIKSIEHVKKIQVVTKERAWQDLKSQMNLPLIRNPLPDTLHVSVDKQKNLEGVVNKIKHFREIEEIRYAKDLAQKMRIVSDIGNITTVVVVLILGGLTIFIISNTIQLAIQSKKNEIEIMRLMGVSNWYIKAPFILQGGFYGLTGAIIANIPLNILQSYLEQANTFFGIPNENMSIKIVMLCVFAMGIIFGAGGSILSVKKYLQV